MLYATGQAEFIPCEARKHLEGVKVYLYFCQAAIRKHNTSVACSSLDTQLAQPFCSFKTPVEPFKICSCLLRGAILLAYFADLSANGDFYADRLQCSYIGG